MPFFEVSSTRLVRKHYLVGCIWNRFVAELALKHMVMESVKAYVIGWLDWGANYVKEDPEDFFSKCEHHYSSLINFSRMQA